MKNKQKCSPQKINPLHLTNITILKYIVEEKTTKLKRIVTITINTQMQLHTTAKHMNRSGEPKFNSWWEQFLARLYLPPSRTPTYYGTFPLGTGGLTPKI